MTLEAIESELTDLRERAEQIRNAYTRDARNIDQDETLSDTGKNNAKAEAKEHHKANASALRAREVEIIDKRIRSLEQQIEASGKGGSSSDIIAFRDAHDRADRLQKADEAMPVMQRALRNGDTSLAHAIFRRAIEANWTGVINAFTAENPQLKDVIRELRAVQEIKDNTMGRTMAYAILG